MEKRIYSLNLIAFITYKTGRKPQLHKTEDNTFYAVFEEASEVGKAIIEFKNDSCKVELHRFLNEFKELKQQINKLRGE